MSREEVHECAELGLGQKVGSLRPSSARKPNIILAMPPALIWRAWCHFLDTARRPRPV
jgi:hypothetical protein